MSEVQVFLHGSLSISGSFVERDLQLQVFFQKRAMNYKALL